MSAPYSRKLVMQVFDAWFGAWRTVQETKNLKADGVIGAVAVIRIRRKDKRQDVDEKPDECPWTTDDELEIAVD